MSRLLQKYASVDINAVDEEEEQARAAASSSEFLKVPEGSTLIRILPPLVGQRLPWALSYRHYLDVPGTDRKIQFNCPNLTGNAGHSCRACDEKQILERSPSKLDKERAWKVFKARPRLYANVVNRADEDSGVLVFGFGKKIWDDLRSCLRDYGDFTHPYEGWDIKIIRKGTGPRDTEYRLVPDRAESPLHDDEEQMEEWLEMAHDLSEYTRVPTSEEIDEMFGDALSNDGEGDGRVRRGRRNQNRALSSGRNVGSRRGRSRRTIQTDERVVDVEATESDGW